MAVLGCTGLCWAVIDYTGLYWVYLIYVVHVVKLVHVVQVVQVVQVVRMVRIISPDDMHSGYICFFFVV